MFVLLKINPNFFKAYLNKGERFEYILRNELQNLGKFNDAIKMYDLAIKINPNNAKAYINKGIRLITILKPMALVKWDNLIKSKNCIIYQMKSILIIKIRVYYLYKFIPDINEWS